MKKEIEMKVSPSFCDEECAIIFSFHFKREKQKVGEAHIYTCAEGFHKITVNENEAVFSVVLEESQQISLEKTVAFIEEFAVMEEYKQASFKNIMDFLKAIGIKTFFYKKRTVPSDDLLFIL